MRILDKLMGRDDEPQRKPAQHEKTGSAHALDEQAIARYRYMLKTAPPETIEQAHAEAFAVLTPEQRSLLLQQLSVDLPEAERSAGTAAAKDPHSLARLATRAEIRRPGSMERAFGGMSSRGIGMGGMLAGSFLSSIAGAVIGSAIAQSFFSESHSGDSGLGDSAQGESTDAMLSDASADAGTDFGDFDGGDFGDV